MSDALENYERDIAWLLSKKSNVSVSEQDLFADKVALFMLDGQGEKEARKSALELLNNFDLGW